MSNYKTDQESFWAGDFGNDYSERNTGKSRVASATALFSKVLKRTHGIQSVIEFGSNTGTNLQAINNLLPHAKLSAIEINEKAIESLKKLDLVENIYHQSVLDSTPVGEKYDLVLIKGVLIHIDPEELFRVYERLYQLCERYLLIAEYYNPVPIEVNYRGHEGKLFKRDFAGEFLDKYDDMGLIDYGFIWRKDLNFPLDDITWFLLEKICTEKT